MQLHIVIYGQVQGVFFRSSTKEVAEKLGIVGGVKNNSDGSVETLAQGTKENLEKFLTWFKKGPSGARVEDVEVEWSQATSQYKDFEILR